MERMRAAITTLLKGDITDKYAMDGATAESRVGYTDSQKTPSVRPMSV